MKRILASSGCTDGDCPTIWQDDRTGTVTVRGYSRPGLLAWLRGQHPERDVTIPGDVWLHLSSQLHR